MAKKQNITDLPRKDRIIKLIGSLGDGQNVQITFFDWVTLMAMSIINTTSSFKHDDVWKRREDLYMNIAKKYTPEQMRIFTEAMAYLAEELEEKPYDVLGEIYHKLDAQNKKTGQFFTPFHLSVLMAMLQEFKDEEITMNEPTCGAGGMILAAARVMQDRGIDYQRRMKVVAQDIDWNCVYMAYVQLSLAGIKATVIQGDTLRMEPQTKDKVFYTPAYMLGLW